MTGGELLEKKREGGKHTEDDIRSFVRGVVDGTVSRPQAAAWLAFAFVRGLDDDETVWLTRAMTESGDRLTWPGLTGPFVDKHSTGGVGDKVSLVLAPLWAELGAKVPMVSGRGLGHTGGTLDKLESIRGYRVDLDTADLHAVLRDVGCFITGQTSELAPADRILYALRNETATVPSIPLITASILSKKLAEGIDTLVMDVKWGSGAFMKTRESASALAESLVRVGNGAGVSTRAVLSEMNEPLGVAVGNSLEVEEAVRCLRGEGPADLDAITCDLIGDPRAKALLKSGAAYERWCRMVHAQGGDPESSLAHETCEKEVIVADRDGVLTRCDAYGIGRAAFVLGAGRERAEDPVDPGVGLLVHKKVGERVTKGEPLLTLLHRDRSLDRAVALARAALAIGAT